MLKTPGSRRALVYAVLLHVALLALLVVSFRWTKTTFFAPRSDQPIVQATAVTDAATRKEVERLKQEQERRDREAERKRLEEERRRKAEELKQAEAEKKRKEAEAKKAEAEKKRVEDARKAEERKKLDEARKLDAEKKRKEEAKKAEAEKKRKAEATKAETEKKRKAEELKKADAEKKRKEAEAKKAEAEGKRKEQERALQEQLAREEQERAQAQAVSASAREIDRFKALIAQKVERNWTRPPEFHKGLVCTIRVRTVSSGEVVSAAVVRSSGNPLFDRSAEVAVRKATPLPVPEDPELFRDFREFDFEFRPEA
jgi:colicin import membrane protein